MTELMEDKAYNPCCDVLKKKYTKLLEKYSKVEALKNQFRDCTALLRGKYDAVEKENASLKKDFDELKMETNMWKDEKEKESGIRVDLEDEVTALKEEIESLKRDANAGSQEANKQLQERLNVTDKEIKKLKELLDKERREAASQKKTLELEKKKAEEALKNLEIESLKRDANAGSREANDQLQERLNVADKEIKKLKELLDKERRKAASEKKTVELEKKKAEEALKNLEIESLKRDANAGFREANEQLQERLDVADKEIKKLKELLDTERRKAASEKKTVELEKKKAEEALKKLEIESLKRDGNPGFQEANEQLQERLNVADKEIKKLKELLDKERRKAALEKKTVELEKKKAEEALKKLEMNKNKLTEAENMANAERKRAEDNRLLWEKLKKETDAMKSKLALEKSKSESACKQVEVEKQNTIRERERADSALAEAEEQSQHAEMNLKKAMFEKDRADDLNQKFEEASNKAKNLEETLNVLLRAGKSLEAQPDASNSSRNVELASGYGEMQKNDAVMLMEKMLLEKEQEIIREKNRADSEKRVANKQKNVASEYKKKARKQKHRTDELSRELERCRLRIEGLQTDLIKSYSYGMHAENSSLRYNDTIADTDMVKKLNNQLKLEKMLVKYAKKASEVEALRNSMLYQELVELKQEFLQLQLRFDILDNSFLHGGEGIQQLRKIGNCIPSRETLCSDDYHGQGQLISGINSGLDPPHRGSNQKMLKSSAINSSSASFSDRPLVGSQEGCTLSVPSAKLGEEISKIKPNVSQFSAKAFVRSDELAVKADNTTKSLVKKISDKRRIESHEKRQILDAVQSIEKLYHKGEKLQEQVSDELSLLHGILDQKDEPEEETLNDNSGKDLARSFKRRKVCNEGTMVSPYLRDNEDAKSSLDSDIGLSNALMAASPGGSATIKFDAHITDGTNGIFATDQCKSQYFDMMLGRDYMKLLDLDNAADENSYRKAIAMPLSPLPPVIELGIDKKLEVDNPHMLLDKSSQKGLESFREGVEFSSNFHDIALENNPIDAVLHCSQQHTNGGSMHFMRSTDSVPDLDIDVQQAHVSGGKLRKLNLTGSESKESTLRYEIGIATLPGGSLKQYVVHSNNRDKQSILRILQTIDSCMPHCSTLDSAGTFVQSVMQSLLMAPDISMKEKVCVLFSIVLHGISENETKNWSNVLSYDFVQSLDVSASHIFSALTNPVLRRKFMKTCDLFELLLLIEDFLMHMKVLVSSDLSSMPQDIVGSKVNIVLTGNEIMLSEVVASAPLLIAGGSMLASLCIAVDHIGCICEMSCNILMFQKCDPAVMLAVLHTFAHVCGSKYFTLQHHSSAMTVVKAMVMFLEKKNLSANPTSVYPSSVRDISTVWVCCTDCPFSKGAVPIENVASMLLENLHKLSQSVSWTQDNFEAVNSVFRGRLPENKNDNALGFGESNLSTSAYDETLLEFVDSLSLMEIPASCMSLNWTAEHIIGPICTFLELHITEGFCAGIFILLGHLGRLGVNTNGYNDSRVEKLREWLSGFLCKTWFTKFSLPVQFAIVISLFGLTLVKLEEVTEDEMEMQAVTNQCIPASFIREWFSLLNPDQQSLLRRSCSSGGPQL